MYARVLRLYHYTGNVSFEIITYVQTDEKTASKNFSSFGNRRTEPVLRLQLFPLFHPLLPFSIDQHRNKTTTNTTIPNVSLPSSIAGTIYFDLDQCLPTNLFQIATKRFPFLPLYSKICTRIRELPSCFTSRIVHTELIQLRYKFQRDSPNSTIRYFTQTFSSFFFQI